MVQDLEVRDAARPGGEIGVEIKPVELPPQDETRLLQQVFGVGLVGHERVDEAVQSPLMEREQLHKQFVAIGTVVSQRTRPLLEDAKPTGIARDACYRNTSARRKTLFASPIREREDRHNSLWLQGLAITRKMRVSARRVIPWEVKASERPPAALGELEEVRA
jgi:hypothetical protein